MERMECLTTPGCFRPWCPVPAKGQLHSVPSPIWSEEESVWQLALRSVALSEGLKGSKGEIHPPYKTGLVMFALFCFDFFFFPNCIHSRERTSRVWLPYKPGQKWAGRKRAKGIKIPILCVVTRLQIRALLLFLAKEDLKHCHHVSGMMSKLPDRLGHYGRNYLLLRNNPRFNEAAA